MLISEILEQAEEFPTIVTDATVRSAAELMHTQNVRAVPVVESGRLVGIITDWDIVVALADRSSELANAPVSAIMTSQGLVTIERGATAAEAAARLAEHRLHHLPVLDGESYVGMICLGLEWTEQTMLTPPVRPTLTARHP
jgi:CBS domain-containing protein